MIGVGNRRFKCEVPENISKLPPQEGLEFPGGEGSGRPKQLKEMYEA